MRKLRFVLTYDNGISTIEFSSKINDIPKQGEFINICVEDKYRYFEVKSIKHFFNKKFELDYIIINCVGV